MARAVWCCRRSSLPGRTRRRDGSVRVTPLLALPTPSTTPPAKVRSHDDASRQSHPPHSMIRSSPVPPHIVPILYTVLCARRAGPDRSHRCVSRGDDTHPSLWLPLANSPAHPGSARARRRRQSHRDGRALAGGKTPHADPAADRRRRGNERRARHGTVLNEARFTRTLG